MRAKTKKLSNFTQAIHRSSPCFRPESETQLNRILQQLIPQTTLARGAGLSYSDCCFNQDNPIIDCSRLNHFISFDEVSGLLVCQAGITFAELLHIHPDFIPPVIPGTLKASLGGGIANDVHGKNNSHAGTLGHHIEWLELNIGSRLIRCSRQENAELFFASLGGLGLTGIIKRLAIRLKKASPNVEVTTQRLTHWQELLPKMQENAPFYEYQVAWLDCLTGKDRAILSQANHCDTTENSRVESPSPRQLSVPPLPWRLISPQLMKQFNHLYFHIHKDQKKILSLSEFNNPLDRINHWNRVYGKNGLIQFQAVFPVAGSEETLTTLLALIKNHRATPTLAVLKYFSQAGPGLLSFAQSGFTLAIDFIHNQFAVETVKQMNAVLTQLGGKIYLAKDLLLSTAQFQQQYPQHAKFSELLQRYQCTLGSDLSRRLTLGSSLGANR